MSIGTTAHKNKTFVLMRAWQSQMTKDTADSSLKSNTVLSFQELCDWTLGVRTEGTSHESNNL